MAAIPVDAHPPALVLTLPAEPPVAAQLVAEPAWETISMMEDSKRIRLMMIFGFILILIVVSIHIIIDCKLKFFLVDFLTIFMIKIKPYAAT